MLHLPYHPHVHVPHPHPLDATLSIVGEVSGTQFNDSEALHVDTFTYITEVIVFYDESQVFGLNVKYENLNGQETAATHSPKVSSASAVLTLGRDEYINRISGKLGSGVVRLKLETNRGHYVDVGGEQGDNFSLQAPLGFGVKAFTGRLGARLLAIGAELRPIMMRRSLERQYPNRREQTNRLDFSDVFPRNPEVACIKRIGMTFNPQSFTSLEVLYWGEDSTVTKFDFPKVGSGEETSDVFDLALGEGLKSVHGTVNNGVVTSVGFETIRGRKRAWGTPSGAPFKEEVPAGHRVVGLETVSNASGLQGLKLDLGYPLP